MIISSTRAASTYCWRACFNTYHRDLSAPKSMNLMDGSGLHDAAAIGLATKDWAQARAYARTLFDKSIPTASIDEFNVGLVEDHWDLVDAMISTFEKGIGGEDYIVIQPECLIDVPLPGSEHNCIWLHHIEVAHADYSNHPYEWKEVWGLPDPKAILEKRIRSPHQAGNGMDCPCWQPHRLVGQTDALVRWQGHLWLLEHKTDSTVGENFWTQWELDSQPTLYLYGIWKSLGIEVAGCVVNRIAKPTEKQVAGWNARRKDPADFKGVKDYITYDRQAFTRTQEDLLRAERCMIELCDEWEHRILHGWFRPELQRTACVRWGRRCDYHTACSNHEEPGSFSGLITREHRYDDKKLDALIQLVTPSIV